MGNKKKSNNQKKLKKKLNIEKIIRTSSIVFLTFLFIFFSSRFTYNYIIENVIDKQETTNLLSDKIISNTNKENLSYESGKYTIKGKIDNNYVSYSGLLWRVMEVENDNIKLVTDDSVTLLPWGNNKKYIDSNIYNWLYMEEGFMANLTSPELYLNQTNYCINNTDTINITECENINNYVSILSMNDYILSGANEGYLNNNSYFWLSANNDKNEAWYVFENGGVKTENENHIYGVRTVVTLKSIEYIYGDGTISSPYVISNEPVNILKEIELGNYVEFSNYTWKVVSKNLDSVKLVLDSHLEMNEEEIKKVYSKKYSEFNLQDNTGIAYYLNNVFYNKLEHKEYLKQKDFYIGKFNSYSLEEIYNEKVSAYVGLLTIGDIFLTENDNMYLLSSIKNDNTIPIINENNTLFYDLINYESNIKPVIYLDNEIEVKGGIGNINYPFELRLEND